MEDKIWIEINVSICGNAISDEYMLKNLEHYGTYNNIDDAIGALLDIKNFMGEENEV